MTWMGCICGKKAKYVKHMKFNGYDIDGWHCNHCGEEYFNPEKAEVILLLNQIKKKGYILKLGQIKSNLILRIPKEVSDVLKLDKGREVTFKLKNDHSFEVEFVKAKP